MMRNRIRTLTWIAVTAFALPTATAQPEETEENVPADDEPVEVLEDLGEPIEEEVVVVDDSIEIEPESMGLWGWGLGLELPLAGVITGLASKSSPGVGYTVGGALTYQLNHHWLIRLHYIFANAFGGEARLKYVENAQTQTSTQDANWLSAEAGLGAAYYFREVVPLVSPFVGLSAGVNFAGYDYLFDDSLVGLEAEDVGNAFQQCTSAGCKSDIHDGLDFGWFVTARGGAEYEMLKWLATQAELFVTYTRVPQDKISNTFETRKVRSVPENVFLVGLSFTARLML